MFQWLRNLLSVTHAFERASANIIVDGNTRYTRFKFTELYVEPDDPDDFELEACDKRSSILATHPEGIFGE